jgi:hypothetical protein
MPLDKTPLDKVEVEPVPGIVGISSTEERQLGSAEERRLDAETQDIATNTQLKARLSWFIGILMLTWFVFIAWIVLYYINYQRSLSEVIPKEVILGVLTAGASVVTLMGFILKGLFNSGE